MFEEAQKEQLVIKVRKEESVGESEAVLSKCSEPPSGTLQWQDRQIHTRSFANSFFLVLFWNETQKNNTWREHLPSLSLASDPFSP